MCLGLYPNDKEINKLFVEPTNRLLKGRGLPVKYQRKNLKMKGNDDDDNYIDDAFDDEQDKKDGGYMIPDDEDDQAQAVNANANVVGNGQI